MTNSAPRTPPLYSNPVWPGKFGDPFVLKHARGYVAFGTGPSPDGRSVPMLASEDLVAWRELPGALPADPHPLMEYWAPEAVEHEGRFYLYFSKGDGHLGHAVRVAVADAPEGPYEEIAVVSDPRLPFAIDGHPFRDRDGTFYLFYAADVLEGERPGTSLFVDRIVSMTRLAGEARCILRADADWQIYKRDREAYGAVYDWHTLEGPTVLYRDGRYVMLFSGGNFGDVSYGVDFATAAHPLGPWHHDPVELPRLLRSSGSIIGPGHNSVTQDPLGNDVAVYHAWDPSMKQRTMRIDPILWTEDGPRIDGPSLGERLLVGTEVNR